MALFLDCVLIFLAMDRFVTKKHFHKLKLPVSSVSMQSKAVVTAKY